MKRATVLLLVMASAFSAGADVAGQTTPTHTFFVTAQRYSFEPATLEVHQGDVVGVTIQSADIPHSFTIDEYRISKRAGADAGVTVEFLADRVGSFTIYCSLTAEEGCRSMQGVLIVRPARARTGR